MQTEDVMGYDVRCDVRRVMGVIRPFFKQVSATTMYTPGTPDQEAGQVSRSRKNGVWANEFMMQEGYRGWVGVVKVGG